MQALEADRQSNEIDCLHLTDDELIAEIKRRAETCARTLVELANVVCPALRRGLQLPFIRPGLLDVLRKIEGRQILPELANQFMYCRAFQQMKFLPIDDQKAIVDTGKIEVVVRRGERFDVRKLDVDALTRDQVKLVFASGRIRTQTEMITILEGDSEIEEDPYDESMVSFRLPSVSIDLTKAESKLLKEKATRSGGLAELVKHAIKRMV